MLRFTLLCLITLALAACQSVGQTKTTPEQQVAAGCATASASMRVLTLANDAGKLSADQQRSILSAAGYISPICAAEEPPTLDSLKLEAFTRAIVLLQAQAARLEKSP